MSYSKIVKLNNPEYSSFVSWYFQGQKVEIKNSGRLLAMEKKDGNILIIHIDRNYGSDNAFIYHPDGTQVRRIANYAKDEGMICYDDAYYVEKELTLFTASREKRIACVISESGDFIRSYETR